MVLPHGAATIAELLLLLDREATTATTTMPTAALQCGAAAPARPPGAGVARLRGIMVAEAPTAPEEVPLSGDGGSGSATGFRGSNASWAGGSGSATGFRGGTASWGGGSGSYHGAFGRSGSWSRR